MKTQFTKILKVALVTSSLMLFSANAEQPEELKVFHTRENFKGLDAKVFPIGWTKDGSKLAVIVVPADEASGIERWTLQVIDLTTNKTELSKVFPIEISDEAGDIDGFWKTKGESVTSLLKPYEIESADFKLHPFPLLLGKFRGKFYEAKIDRTYGTDPNREFVGIEAVNISLVSGKDKEKKIFEKQWEWSYPAAASVTGYIPNPQGDRVAILLGFVQYGYEGAPHIRNIQIIGAN